jgi:hypothetical protein
MLKKIEIFGEQQYPACYLVTTVTSRGPCAAFSQPFLVRSYNVYILTWITNPNLAS